MLYQKMMELKKMTLEGTGKYVKTLVQNFLFEYETPRVVKVYSTRLGLINRGVQAIVLCWLIGLYAFLCIGFSYIFIWSKGYQNSEDGESNTVAKVKGMIKTDFPPSTGANNVWDSTDLGNPTQSDAAFIATNFIQTPSQQSGRCPEDENTYGAKCDNGCPAGEPIILGNGFKTGFCNRKTGTCEIEGWCPTEKDEKPEPPLILDSANFTILVKNYVWFPEFEVKRRNIPEWLPKEHITKCNYHPQNDPYCPIFKIQDLVTLANESYSQVARSGAVFAFMIKWDCDLDQAVKLCLPVYDFKRMDSPDEKVAAGWNFRHADYWNAPDGTRRRTLYKFYGLRFVFVVHAKARKFSYEKFAMNLGSGVGLFGVATVLCDFLTFYLLKKNLSFKDRKIDRIRDVRSPQLTELLEKHIKHMKEAETPESVSEHDDTEPGHYINGINSFIQPGYGNARPSLSGSASHKFFQLLILFKTGTFVVWLLLNLMNDERPSIYSAC